MAGTTGGGGTHDLVGGAELGTMGSLYGSLPQSGDSVQQRVIAPTDPNSKQVSGGCCVAPDRAPVVLSCHCYAGFVFGLSLLSRTRAILLYLDVLLLLYY